MDIEKLKFPIGKCSYPILYTPEIRADFQARIRSLPERIGELVENFTPEQLMEPYRAGGWNSQQVIHHLADSHMNALIRIKLALTEDKPAVKPYLEAEFAKLVDYDQHYSQSLNLLEYVHQKMYIIYRAMSDSDRERTYFHPEHKEEFSLNEQLCLYAWHGDHHYMQIKNLKERMKW